jgi:hypothetical protein
MQSLPDGQISKTCPAPFQKIFRWSRRANQRYRSRRPARERGVSRSSRTRVGMRWTRQRRARQVCSQGGIAVSEQRRAGRTALLPNSPKLRRKGTRPGEACWRRRVAYGKTVWSRHPLLVSSCRWRHRSDRIDEAIKPAATVTKRIRRRGERGISRKAIAQGMSDCFR